MGFTAPLFVIAACRERDFPLDIGKVEYQTAVSEPIGALRITAADRGRDECFGAADVKLDLGDSTYRSAFPESCSGTLTCPVRDKHRGNNGTQNCDDDNRHIEQPVSNTLECVWGDG